MIPRPSVLHATSPGWGRYCLGRLRNRGWSRSAVGSGEVVPKLTGVLRMAQFGERLGLDLAHPLPRDAEHDSHLLERARLAVRQAVAQLDHLALALAETAEHSRE